MQQYQRDHLYNAAEDLVRDADIRGCDSRELRQILAEAWAAYFEDKAKQGAVILDPRN